MKRTQPPQQHPKPKVQATHVYNVQTQQASQGSHDPSSAPAPTTVQPVVWPGVHRPTTAGVIMAQVAKPPGMGTTMHAPVIQVNTTRSLNPNALLPDSPSQTVEHPDVGALTTLNGWSVGEEIVLGDKRGYVEAVDSKKGLLVRWPGMKRRRYMSWNKKTLKRLERAKNPKKAKPPSARQVNRRSIDVSKEEDEGVKYCLSGIYHYNDTDVVVVYKNGRWGAVRFYACPKCTKIKAHVSVDYIAKHTKKCRENDARWAFRLSRVTRRFNNKDQLDAYTPPMFPSNPQNFAESTVTAPMGTRVPALPATPLRPEDNEETNPRALDAPQVSERSAWEVADVLNKLDAARHLEEQKQWEASSLLPNPAVNTPYYSLEAGQLRGRRRRDFFVDTAREIAALLQQQRQKWWMNGPTSFRVTATFDDPSPYTFEVQCDPASRDDVVALVNNDSKQPGGAQDSASSASSSAPASTRNRQAHAFVEKSSSASSSTGNSSTDASKTSGASVEPPIVHVSFDSQAILGAHQLAAISKRIQSQRRGRGRRRSTNAAPAVAAATAASGRPSLVPQVAAHNRLQTQQNQAQATQHGHLVNTMLDMAPPMVVDAHMAHTTVAVPHAQPSVAGTTPSILVPTPTVAPASLKSPNNMPM